MRSLAHSPLPGKTNAYKHFTTNLNIWVPATYLTITLWTTTRVSPCRRQARGKQRPTACGDCAGVRKWTRKGGTCYTFQDLSYMLHIYVTSYTCYSKLQVTHLRLPELHFYTEVINDNILSRSCLRNSHADKIPSIRILMTLLLELKTKNAAEFPTSYFTSTRKWWMITFCHAHAHAIHTLTLTEKKEKCTRVVDSINPHTNDSTTRT